MTHGTMHSFGDIILKCNDSRVALKVASAPGKDSIVKIEIDRSISSLIGPKDVLEALQSCDFEGDSADIVIKGTTYDCTFVEPKAAVFALGKTPQSSEDISERYLGTLCVFPKGCAPHKAAEESKSWQHEPSYRKFRKPVPFGYQEAPTSQ